MEMTDDALHAAYEEQGYVILRGLYTNSDMRRWKEEAAIARENAEGNFGVHVWMLGAMPPFFREAFAQPTLVEPVRAMLGGPVEFCSAKPVFKSTKIRAASPWHQDRAYWGGVPKLSIWLALEPATPENGCLRVIPGGHTLFLEHDNPNEETPPEERGFVNRLKPEMLPMERAVDCVMEAGDAIFFHDLLPHSSHPNSSGRERWSLIPTYRRADITDPSEVWSETLPL